MYTQNLWNENLKVKQSVMESMTTEYDEQIFHIYIFIEMGKTERNINDI